MNNWRLLTAMATPFKPDSSLDREGVGVLARHLAATGTDAIVVAGTTGESPTLTHEEKLELFHLVKEAVPEGVGVVAGCGTNSTAASIELAREAARMGVDGLMAVVPYYNKPPQEAMYRHFASIAEAVDLPIMVYNVPGRTGANLLPDTVARLAEIPNIAAIKEASGNLDQASEICRRCPDLVVYSGDDSLTLPIMSVGGRGIVSVASHIVGEQIKEMILAYEAGDVREAARIHGGLFLFFKACFVTSNPIPLKAALALAGLPGGGLRLPLIEANAREVETVRKAMEQVGVPLRSAEGAHLGRVATPAAVSTAAPVQG